jgi:hypothetical protein
MMMVPRHKRSYFSRPRHWSTTFDHDPRPSTFDPARPLVLPASVPAGTTPRSFLTALLPAEHARLVPSRAGRARVLVHLGDDRFLLSADGDRLNVSEFTDPLPPTDAAEAPADVLVSFDEPTVRRFLEDWSGPRRWLPRFEPREVALLTDARLLRRLAMVMGRIELAIDDFEGSRAAVTLAAGSRAIKNLDADPDVSVELSMDTFERLLAGTLGPDEAIADRHVTVRGKTLVAMQFALALVPFFPPK